jgi:Kef-type K+ transport system membrane component KefB
MNTAASAVHQTENLVFLVLLDLIVIIIAARLAGNAARRLGQPRVVGEIIAGLLLGPSLLGAIFPEVSAYLFQSISVAPLNAISQLGLILLMFQIGMDFDFSHLKEIQNRAAVTSVSVACIVLPFVLGYGLGQVSAPYLASDIPSLPYSLFIGTALSITAVPILGRIMMEFDLTRTRMGAVVISAAAVNDVIGWTILAVISALSISNFSLGAVFTQLALIALYLAVCWWLVRPLLCRLIRHFDLSGERMPQNLLGTMLVLIFISAICTFKIGIFAIFGGFMLGVLVHDQKEFVALWKRTIGDFVIVFFLPVFFTFAGLRTDIGGLDSASLWFWCFALIAAAVAGKMLSGYAAARMASLDHHEAYGVAVLMNTRALMELVVVNIGYEYGYIPQDVYTMLVIVAITTTVMTSPLLRGVLPRMGHVVPRGIDA